jgi:hypothetical protein
VAVKIGFERDFGRDCHWRNENEMFQGWKFSAESIPDESEEAMFAGHSNSIPNLLKVSEWMNCHSKSHPESCNCG